MNELEQQILTLIDQIDEEETKHFRGYVSKFRSNTASLRQNLNQGKSFVYDLRSVGQNMTQEFGRVLQVIENQNGLLSKRENALSDIESTVSSELKEKKVILGDLDQLSEQYLQLEQKSERQILELNAEIERLKVLVETKEEIVKVKDELIDKFQSKQNRISSISSSDKDLLSKSMVNEEFLLQKLEEKEAEHRKILEKKDLYVEQMKKDLQQVRKEMLEQKDVMYVEKLKEKVEMYEEKLSEKEELYTSKLKEREELYRENMKEKERQFEKQLKEMKRISDLELQKELYLRQSVEEKMKLLEKQQLDKEKLLMRQLDDKDRSRTQRDQEQNALLALQLREKESNYGEQVKGIEKHLTIHLQETKKRLEGSLQTEKLLRDQMKEKDEQYQEQRVENEKRMAEYLSMLKMKEKLVTKLENKNKIQAEKIRSLDESTKTKDRMIDGMEKKELRLKRDSEKLDEQMKKNETYLNEKNEILKQLNSILIEKDGILKRVSQQEKNEALLSQELEKRMEILNEMNMQIANLKEENQNLMLVIDNQKNIINELTIKNEMVGNNLGRRKMRGKRKDEEEKQRTDPQLSNLVNEIKLLADSLNSTNQSLLNTSMRKEKEMEEKKEMEESGVQTEAIYRDEFVEKYKEEIRLLKSFLKKKDEKLEILSYEIHELRSTNHLSNVDKKIISILQSKLKIAQKYLSKLTTENNNLKMEKENLRQIILKQMDQLDLYSIQIKEQDETLEQMKGLFSRQGKQNQKLKKQLARVNTFSKENEFLKNKNNILREEAMNLKEIVQKQTKLIKNFSSNRLYGSSSDIVY